MKHMMMDQGSWANKAVALFTSLALVTTVAFPAQSYAAEINEIEAQDETAAMVVSEGEKAEVAEIAINEEMVEEKAIAEEATEPTIVEEAAADEALADEAAAEEQQAEEPVKTYTITWKDEDGTVLAQSEVAAGEMPEYPGEELSKAEDANCTYAFAGWSPKVAKATNDRSYRAVYEATAKAKDTPADESLGNKAQIVVTNIMKVGAMNSVNIQTLTKGQTKTMTATGVLNLVGGKNYKSSLNDISYTFLNVYAFSTGKTAIWNSATDDLTISKLKNNGDGTMTATMSDGSIRLVDSNVAVVSPVYSITRSWYLNHNRIDNISTGSGSWQNEGATRSYTHTFKDPEAQPHYQFVIWEEEGTGATYANGEKFTYSNANPGEDQVVVNTYAVWQPSVTVNYYSWDGKLLKSVEQFTDITTNDFAAPEVDGAEFLGWYAGMQADAAEADATYKAPATTKNPVKRTEHDVYARYSTNYTVLHALQDAEDGGYTVLDGETETHVAILGSIAEAAAKTFEGFTYNAEGSLAKAAIDQAGIVLKLFYDRNIIPVSDESADEVPAPVAPASTPAAPTAPTATPTAPTAPTTAPTATPTSAPMATTTLFAEATAAAAPATQAAQTAIADDATPLAGEIVAEVVADDETPLAGHEHDAECWVHWWMLLGMLITAIYTVVVAIRRASEDDEQDDTDQGNAQSENARPFGYGTMLQPATIMIQEA